MRHTECVSSLSGKSVIDVFHKGDTFPLSSASPPLLLSYESSLRIPWVEASPDILPGNGIGWWSGALWRRLVPRVSLASRPASAAQTLCDNPSRPVVVIADGAEWIGEGTSAALPAGHLYPGLGPSLARGQSCH